MWCKVDALFPSVYQFYNSENSAEIAANNRQYVRSNVAEATRIAGNVPSMCNGTRPRPQVMVYTWDEYHSGVGQLCDQDAQMCWVESYGSGADSLVMWGNRPTNFSAANFSRWYHGDFAPLVNSWHPAESSLGGLSSV